MASLHRTETNQRIYQRNIPSNVLQPYFDFRPVMTKYSFLPIVEPKKQFIVPLKQYPIYNNEKIFNPGNTQSPFSGYTQSVNLESELRGQIFALQKCSQSVYIPKSTSDLYIIPRIENKTSSSISLQNPHSLLFQESLFRPFNPNPNPNIIGIQLFGNSTRIQSKESKESKQI